MVRRALAILAAILLVCAVAMAMLLPPGLTLGQGLLMLDGTVLKFLQSHASDWVWERLELPLLVRPVWVLPTALGLICAGGAVTFNSGRASPSRRRRS